MYLYQKSNRFFAQVADDLKELAISELGQFGAREIGPVYRGIYFSTTLETLYKINYQSRFISRILAPLAQFDCHSDKYLYKQVGSIKWTDFFNTDQTFAVTATVVESNIKHSQFAALRVKDGIVDYFRDTAGWRPSIDRHSADIFINLFLNRNKALLSIDTSGGALHRRGYRRNSVDAPMMETLAAALIEHSGWDSKTPLYDPFCGSGTILCEAYLKAAQLPPGSLRKKWGFENLPEFKPERWKQIRQGMLEQACPVAPGLINGSDISQSAVRAAGTNCRQLDNKNPIWLKQCDILKHDPIENATIICNPPYGIRMGEADELNLFYKQFGDFLKQRCTGSTAYIYFGDRQFIKRMGLRSSWKKALNNGGLDGRLVKYELY